MEDFPLLILFFIIYLIAGSSGKKKRKGKADRFGPMRTRGQGEQHDKRAHGLDKQTRDGFENAFPQEPALSGQKCDMRRIHLHDVSNQELLHASEGEDPCHAGGMQHPEEQHEEKCAEFETQQTQDILRGVIMSEILMRPYERRALQRSRQRTNGY